MSEVIIYTRPEDGGVSVVYPSGETTLETVLSQIPEGALNVRLATVDVLPKDREYREAWTDENPGQQVDVCMKKAKHIHMQRIRHARNKKLNELDVEQVRHIQNPKKLQELEDRKQALRDLPAAFELKAENPDALRALWPEGLERG